MKNKRLTKAQREWCKNYEDMTGFEALIDDYHTGAMTFHEAAIHAVRWYEDHASEAHHEISRNIPPPRRADR